jgi:hypothetical protein
VLIDSGASVSVIKPGIATAEIWSTDTIVRGITGNRLNVLGTQVVTFNVGNSVFTHDFWYHFWIPSTAEFWGLTCSEIWEQEWTYELARF